MNAKMKLTLGLTLAGLVLVGGQAKEKEELRATLQKRAPTEYLMRELQHPPIELPSEVAPRKVWL